MAWSDVASIPRLWLTASPLFMPSTRVHAKGSLNGPDKVPPINPVLPPFEPDRPNHGLKARTADRAVLIELRRFLAGIRVLFAEIIRRAL